MQISTRVTAGAIALLVATTAFAALSKDDVKLLNKSAAVLTDLRNAEDNGIPDQIWSKAECIVVIPSLKKAGFKRVYLSADTENESGALQLTGGLKPAGCVRTYVRTRQVCRIFM